MMLRPAKPTYKAMMLDRIVEVFCAVDDFCQAFVPQWEASLLGTGGGSAELHRWDESDLHRRLS